MEPSLAFVLRLYHRCHGKYRKGAAPREDARRRRMWLHYLSQRGIRSPSQLSQAQLLEFVKLRRSGTLKVPKLDLAGARTSASGEPVAVVTNRTIQADIEFLVGVLRWAHEHKRNGVRLVADVPIKRPRNLATPLPKRPLATDDDVDELLRVAEAVDPQRLFGYFLRLLAGLGWRVTAVCAIRASDVDLRGRQFAPFGRIRKNPLVDKKGIGQFVPLSKEVYDALRDLFNFCELKHGDDVYLFPAKRAQGMPWSRWHAADLLRRAEQSAGVEHLGGTHSFRRLWVTARKGHPTPDLMMTGGWTDTRSFEAYRIADEATMFDVVSNPTRRIGR